MFGNERATEEILTFLGDSRARHVAGITSPEEGEGQEELGLMEREETGPGPLWAVCFPLSPVSVRFVISGGFLEGRSRGSPTRGTAGCCGGAPIGMQSSTARPKAPYVAKNNTCRVPIVL